MQLIHCMRFGALLMSSCSYQPLQSMVSIHITCGNIPFQTRRCASTAVQGHTHTPLLRTVLSTFVVECIQRAKTIQLYLTGVGQ